MKSITIHHELPCDIDTFWSTFLDEGFNSWLYAQLGFPEYRTVERRETDTQIVRKVRGVPKMELPSTLEKAFGSTIAYTEDASFDKPTRVWRWRMTPSTLAEKLRLEGTVRAETLPGGRVRRIADIEIEAKVFGLGGLIESAAESNLRRGWDDSARLMTRWFNERRA